MTHWHAEGLRWIAGIFTAAADRLESTIGTSAVDNTHELYFDSDSYLADLRNKVFRYYY
jgi:hypothetical protein